MAFARIIVEMNTTARERCCGDGPAFAAACFKPIRLTGAAAPA